MTEDTLSSVIAEGVEVLHKMRSMPPRRLNGDALVEAFMDAAGATDERLDEIEYALRDHADAAAAVGRLARLVLDRHIGEVPTTDRAAKIVRSTSPESAQAQFATVGATATEVLALAARRAVTARPERFADGCDDLEAWDRSVAARMSSLADIEATIRDTVKLSDLEWTAPPPARSFSERDIPSRLVFKIAPSVPWTGDGGTWPRDLIEAVTNPPTGQPQPAVDPYADEDDRLTPMEKLADEAMVTGDVEGVLNVSPVRRAMLDEKL